MAFDLDHWKQKLSEHLPGWKSRMQKAGVNSIYAAISAAALWPVIQSYQQGDIAALLALGSVLGGIGGNLIANQIQSWKDKSESEVTQEIAAQASENTELRLALDALLEKLDVPVQAEQSLPEVERAWFAETLRHELAQLGSAVHFESIQVRDGAVAKGDNAIALGAGARYVGGDMVGNIFEPGSTQTVKVASHETELEEKSLARRRYLERLRKHCCVLPLAALGGEESSEEDISLESVYIALDTTTQVPVAEDEERQASPAASSFLEGKKSHPLSAFEATCNTPRMVLLGNPGAGKSTFARHLLAWQAAVHLEGLDPPPGFSTDLLPVLVVLRDLVPRLTGLELESQSARKQRQTLVNAVRGQLLDDLIHFEAQAFADELSDALASGRCLLVLDGLDEVPAILRSRVRQAVVSLLAEYHLQRVIVTCRVRSYTGEAVFPDFQQFTLAPFDSDKIRDFTQAWYNAQREIGRVTAAQAKEKAADLAQAALSKDLRELSSNPMMLTSMAIVHQKEIGLPRERVRLYSLVVDLLLLRWQRQKVGEHELAPSSSLGAFLLDNLRLRATMERLAYEAHRVRGIGSEAVDLPRGQALTLLEEPRYLGDPGLADEFLDYVDQRAGLLLGRGGEFGKPAAYSFPHRTFQEYLAGCYLVSQREIARAYLSHASDGDYWDLAAVLAAEELYYNRRVSNTLLDLMYHLCPTGFPADERGQRALLWSGQMAVLVGANTIEEDQECLDGGHVYLKKLLPHLVALLGSRKLPALERARAGDTLARLGDPRFNPQHWFLPDEPLLGFIEIPAAPFWMGSDPEQGQQASEDEQPRHEVYLPTFYIARYPVTVAQFRQFVDESGHKFDGWQWNTIPNHPVVSVTWFDTLAYCRWLNGKLSARSQEQLAETGISPAERAFWQGLEDGSLYVRLPGEAEWEKAARGIAGNIYPWGNEWQADHCNSSESGIGNTSAIGCFPAGASPYGCAEMSGNVWEWTRSLWGKDFNKPKYKYPYQAEDGRENLKASKDIPRVLRGGSFSAARRRARCAVRYWDFPEVRSSGFGFRVVVSPFSSGL